MQYTPKALFKVACLSLCLFLSLPFYSSAQADTAAKPSQLKIHDTVATGVAVSPGILNFNVKPGSTQSHTVTITNNTTHTYNFQTSFQDYVQNLTGHPMRDKTGQPKGKYALSKWATISPALVTLGPGQFKKITVTVTIPNEDSLNHAAWTILSIDEVRKKQPVTTPDDKNTLNMGIVPSFGFGVYVYQNPPNVKLNNIEIQDMSYSDTAFEYNKRDSVSRQLYMKVQNTGDGISYCVTYVEVTNLQTGKTVRLGKQQFTILPGYTREFRYYMGLDFPQGNYSSIGVIYFGDKVPKKVAQLNFKVNH